MTTTMTAKCVKVLTMGYSHYWFILNDGEKNEEEK